MPNSFQRAGRIENGIPPIQPPVTIGGVVDLPGNTRLVGVPGTTSAGTYSPGTRPSRNSFGLTGWWFKAATSLRAARGSSDSRHQRGPGHRRRRRPTAAESAVRPNCRNDVHQTPRHGTIQRLSRNLDRRFSSGLRSASVIRGPSRSARLIAPTARRMCKQPDTVNLTASQQLRSHSQHFDHEYLGVPFGSGDGG